MHPLSQSVVSNIFGSRILRITLAALNMAQGIFSDYRRQLREFEEIRHFEGNDSVMVKKSACVVFALSVMHSDPELWSRIVKFEGFMAQLACRSNGAGADLSQCDARAVRCSDLYCRLPLCIVEDMGFYLQVARELVPEVLEVGLLLARAHTHTHMQIR